MVADEDDPRRVAEASLFEGIQDLQGAGVQGKEGGRAWRYTVERGHQEGREGGHGGTQ